jgi:hypothetical protein
MVVATICPLFVQSLESIMLHGTYNTRGVFTPQLVRLGRTQSNKPGLFSGGMLAWPISPEEYDALSAAPRRELEAYALAHGFTLEPAQGMD